MATGAIIGYLADLRKEAGGGSLLETAEAHLDALLMSRGSMADELGSAMAGLSW